MTAAQAQPQAPPAGAAASGERGLYVYCVAGGGGRHELGPVGLDGSEVYSVSAPDAPLCAVVHDCAAEAYASQDTQTAEAWVLAHHRVVAAAAERFGTVLPMAFNTIVRGEGAAPAAGSLLGWLQDRRGRFVRLLGKLAGKAEYSVQVFWDRQAAVEEMLRTDPDLQRMGAEARGKPRGLAHLLDRKLQQAARAAVEAQADSRVRDLYLRIRDCVDDVRVDKPGQGPDGRQTLLKLSCLMPPGRRDLGRLLDEVQALGGFNVRFTGPWPPYSFVAV